MPQQPSCRVGEQAVALAGPIPSLVQPPRIIGEHSLPLDANTKLVSKPIKGPFGISNELLDPLFLLCSALLACIR